MKLKDFVTTEGMELIERYGNGGTFEDGYRLGITSTYVSNVIAWNMMEPIAKMFNKNVTVKEFLDSVGEQDLEDVIHTFLTERNKTNE